MAAHVDTNEGDGEGKCLDEWLKENDLMKIKNKLQNENISLTELKELAQDLKDKDINQQLSELREYAKTELKLDLISRKRFAKAVIALSSKKKEQEEIAQQAPQKQIVHIILTKEESEALKTIDNKKEETNKNMKNISNNINVLKKLEKSNENKLKQIEKEMINKIKERINELNLKSKQEINKKTTVLSNHVVKLEKYMKELNDAGFQTNGLLNDTNIDTTKRRIKIVNIANNILNKTFIEPNITSKVEVEINKAKILNCIAAMGNIRNFTYPDIPVISVNDIKESSATVIFNNMKLSNECSIEVTKNYSSNYNEDDDEKKVNWTKATSKTLNGNKYIICSLDAGTKYGVRSKYKNKYGFGKYSKISTFKTKTFSVNISSTTLTLTDKSTLLSLLQNNEKKIGKSWNLLYRASRDGKTESVFKSKCHNKTNLMCLVRSDDNVFGGYTSTGWFNNGYTKDDKAFIFLVRSSKNYSAAIFNIKGRNTDAIWAGSGYYCVFDGGGTLWFEKGKGKANGNSSVYDKYPHDYYLTNTADFDFNEMEVFQLK